MMPPRGIAFVQLLTRDLSVTRTFWEGTLGFPLERTEQVRLASGERIVRAFFDIGWGQYVAFLDVSATVLADRIDPGINSGLGLPSVAYHLAFDVGSLKNLESKREMLVEHGVTVTHVWDVGWAAAIYFSDPNGLALEYTCLQRDVGRPGDLDRGERPDRQKTYAALDMQPAAMDEKTANGQAPVYLDA
jgi:catechol 2,3-dioxygenase-like lactoylglutathione lyase family enzyme